MTHPILELQAADTMADQLRHRREHLPEREQLQASKNALVRWNEVRMVTANASRSSPPSSSRRKRTRRAIDTHLERLNQQMKTVIAPREAEALQHEIATLKQRRSELDDVELNTLEEQAGAEEELQALLDQEGVLTETYIAADKEANAAETDIDGELARVAVRLTSLREAVDKKILKRYDRFREQHLIAAATLAGSRCEGCHLDLSAAEVDTVKESVAEGGLADCPQCGRLLAV